jgi:hypothetical protein
MLPELPIGAGASQILNSKHINFIAFNEADNEVIVYTGRSVTKKLRTKLPQKVGDIDITYAVGGFGSVGRPPAPPSGNTGAVQHNGRYSCGSSIFVANRVSAGTLGCLVRSTSGVMYGLSNNHVCGDCSYAPSALPILAPGSVDAKPGGIDPFTIGHHDRALKMAGGSPHNAAVDHFSNTDAAVFLIRNENLVSSSQHTFYDTPGSTMAVTGGMEVEKVGRTTGLTKGVVRGQVTGAMPVRYRMPDIEIDFHVYFEPVFVVEGRGGLFADHGDSGALVTGKRPDGSRAAIGLMFSGDGKDLAYVLPIIPILGALDVTLVAGHNV